MSVKIGMVSLGCSKNLVDSERMLYKIKNKGYEIINSAEEADIVVINTCGFIQPAKEEAIDTILEFSQMKSEGGIKKIIVTGCLAERYKEEMAELFPEADAVIGIGCNEDIIDVIENVLAEKRVVKFDDKEKLRLTGERVISTLPFSAYLKIAEGCSNFCSYCAIPLIRGRYRSVPMEELLEEAKYLAEQGVRELILVAQETTLYGQDLYGEKTLPKLLTNLCKIEGIEWIRILYCYPEEITDELIGVIKSQPKICKYLDIPIQHASDRILKLMGRRTDKADLTKIIKKLRKEIPDIILRTTLITGFPTETEEEHNELKEFVQDMKFDRLGVFTYSKEDNTPAALLKPQISEKIKKNRQNELMELQQSLVFSQVNKYEGKVFDLLVEGRITEEDGVYICRTYMDAPQVDGFFFLHSEEELISGSIVKAIVTGAKDYDLVGEIVKGSDGVESTQ